MKQVSAKIESLTLICDNFYECTFTWNPKAGIPLPGQFLTIRVGNGISPLLRRPFAFSGYQDVNGTASIIFQKRGPATEQMTVFEVGDDLDIIGPLGRGFTLPEKPSTPIIIAGGVGLGPMLFLAQWCALHEVSPAFVFGARNALLVPQASLFKDFSVSICTDDGSAGFKGTTVEYLASTLAKNTPSIFSNSSMLYACGPTPMLRACHEFAQANMIPCEVSVEQVMACGVGACMGCVVKVKREPGYARACKDGPVFDSREILWN